jgi:hypothetical protein
MRATVPVPILKCRDAPDTVFTGYPTGRISGESKSQILDIRPDIIIIILYLQQNNAYIQ